MNKYILTYDLKKDGQNYAALYDVLKSYSYARLSESTYLIISTKTADQVFKDFHAHVDRNDFIFILECTGLWAGQAAPNILDWMKSNVA